jgi:CO/xanthine dehydrogenase FAD-binding subunit
MQHRFRYIRPGTLSEALEFLSEHGSSTAILAGGTDLMIAVRRGDVPARFMMDVSRLEELRSIERCNGSLSVGATVTYTELINSPLVRQYAPVLASAARSVGSVQIRNVGTLGGNVANASPAADSVPPLVVHEALVEIRSATSQRTARVEDVFAAPYVTNLTGEELITRFVLKPLDAGYRHGFQRIARRRALSIARISAAALACIDSEGSVTDVRLCVGSILPKPRRMVEAEDLLMGSRPEPELVRKAAAAVSREMIRVSGLRQSTEYKQLAVKGIVTKVISDVLGVGLSNE